MKEYAKALSDLSFAIELEPQHGFAYCDRGFIYNMLGFYERAQSDLERAIVLQPNSALNYLNLAVSLHHTGQLEEARSCLRQAVRLEDSHYSPEITRLLAEIEQKLNRKVPDV
jgi:Flp pilus assembly protein TadD